MIRDSRSPAICMPILDVRTSLPDENEPKRLQNPAYLAWLENGRLWHELRRDCNALRADKLGIEAGFAILQQHLDHLPQVALKFIKSFRL